MAKRNPGIKWADPIQAQGARQQARFLLLVEQTAAMKRGFNPDFSITHEPSIVALLYAAGVSIDQLDSIRSQPGYPGLIDDVLKTPWKEQKRSLVHQSLKATHSALHALWSADCSLKTLKDKDDCSDPIFFSEKEASTQAQYLYGGLIPSVALNYRHQIPELAAALVEHRGDVHQAGLHFSDADRAAINAATVEPIERLNAEAEVIRAKRRAEYRERFGHQPVEDDFRAEFDERMFVATGQTGREYLRQVLNDFIYGNPFGPDGAQARDLINGRLTAAMPSDWSLFGLEPGATADQIKTAFRKLAKQHHPDVGGDQAKFVELAQAAERLLGGVA